MIDEKRLYEDLFLISGSEKQNPFMDYDGSPLTITYKDLLEVIMGQPKVGEWIPCSERLPEPFVMVYVQLKNGENYRAYRGSVWYLDDSSKVDIDEVIAWTPLPEKYKGETE